MTHAAWAIALLLTGAPAASPPPPPATAPAPATAASPQAAPVPEKDVKALALVRKMSDRLRQAQTFSLKARISLELPVEGGGVATFFNEATGAVQRPDRLSAVRTGDLAEFRFAYDGKTMTVFTPGNGKWGTTAAPPTIDAMIVAASEQGDLAFPFDELLVADPYAAITKELIQATLVGTATVAGKKTDHVLLACRGLELQLWIDQATALPARVAMVYTDLAHRPHFQVEYAEWKLDPKLPDSTFAMPLTKGATQVEFRAAAAAFR
jgi:hypothetical protein